MKRIILSFSVIALITLNSPVASATTLTGSLSADDSFIAYLGTSPTVQGSEIATGIGWTPGVSIVPQNLVSGTTYYIQVDATNLSYVGGLLGSFNLSDSGFKFANGTQSLGTDSTHWTYSYTGFGQGSLTPTNYGLNNAITWPWGVIDGGPVPGISTNAAWIWDANQYYPFTVSAPTTSVPSDGGNGDLYFEAAITPEPAPEPASLSLLGAGLLVLGGMIARRKRTV